MVKLLSLLHLLTLFKLLWPERQGEGNPSPLPQSTDTHTLWKQRVLASSFLSLMPHSAKC